MRMRVGRGRRLLHRDVNPGVDGGLGRAPGDDTAAQGQAAHRERGQKRPGENCEPGRDGAAVVRGGLLVKRRCSSPALFGAHG